MRTFQGAALAVAVGAALTVGTPGTSSAADFPATPYYTTPEPLSAYSWAGPYLGATVGFEWGSVDNSRINPSGIAGGIEAGYNFQRGAFVFGGETDLQLSGADDTLSPFEFSNPWFGTLRGRAGVTFNNVLLSTGPRVLLMGIFAPTAHSCRSPIPASAGWRAAGSRSA